jgi:hypothetical protein
MAAAAADLLLDLVLKVSADKVAVVMAVKPVPQPRQMVHYRAVEVAEPLPPAVRQKPATAAAE